MNYSDLIDELELVATPQEVANVIKVLGINLQGEGAYATISDKDATVLRALTEYAINNGCTFAVAAQAFVTQKQQHQNQTKQKKGFDTDLFNLQTLGVTAETAAPGSLQSLIIKDQENVGNYIAKERHKAVILYTDAMLGYLLVNGQEEGAETSSPLLKSEEFLINTTMNLINWERTPEQLQSLIGDTQPTNALPGGL
jgi:hypothetical protein